MTQEPPRTISIPVPAALHTSAGVIMALIAVTAFWVHIELPTGHHYKGTALGVGLLTSFTALTYWIWCGQQCARSETKDVGDALAAAEHEAAEREQRVLEAVGEAVAAVAVLAEEVTDNRGAIKEVTDAVDSATAITSEVLGAVEALQDTYMEEGKPPGTRDFD